MGSKFASERQRRLFAALARAGHLIFACDALGMRLNMEGEFQVRDHGKEDRLEVGDGSDHVHMDWPAVTRAEVGLSRGEGAIKLYAGDQLLFQFFRPAGPFDAEVQDLAGPLL